MAGHASAIQHLAVYASSSDAVEPVFREAARELGHLIGDRGYTLVYGAGSIGLMGVVARAVHERNGRVVGVIPEKLSALEITYEASDELIVTTGMRDRKAIMEARADAFVALPGGFGTLEELLEVLTLKQLDYHNKPIVILNVDGLFDGLLRQFETLFERSFTHDGHRDLYHVATTVAGVFEYLDTYTPSDRPRKVG
ncbi:MAG: TIGR00730 family Rossman fold protein [Candidatus Hydrogenedens sp.]|nr:TIGR00730 family Rossman fold protein [Candidatus Hydrogenedens sp.]